MPDIWGQATSPQALERARFGGKDGDAKQEEEREEREMEMDISKRKQGVMLKER